jgi:hypothetical protein
MEPNIETKLAVLETKLDMLLLKVEEHNKEQTQLEKELEKLKSDFSKVRYMVRGAIAVFMLCGSVFVYALNAFWRLELEQISFMGEVCEEVNSERVDKEDYPHLCVIEQERR